MSETRDDARSLREQKTVERIRVAVWVGIAAIFAITIYDVFAKDPPLWAFIAFRLIPAAAFILLLAPFQFMKTRILPLAAVILGASAVSSTVRYMLNPDYRGVHLMGVFFVFLLSMVFVPYTKRLGTVFFIGIWLVFVTASVIQWPQETGIRLIADNFFITIAAILGLVSLHLRIASDNRETSLINRLSAQTDELRSEIAERSRAEERLRSINNLTKILSELGKQASRATTSQELYNIVCRAFARYTTIHSTAIGSIDTAVGSYIPIISNGIEQDDLRQIWDTSCSDDILAALRIGNPFICNEMQPDPEHPDQHQLAEKLACRSFAVLPLIEETTVTGALMLFSEEVGRFQEEEQDLLYELTGTISLTLQRIRNENHLKQEREALQKSEKEYRQLVEYAHEGIVIVQDSRLVFVNPAISEISGYSHEELMSVSLDQVIHPGDIDEVQRDIHALLSQENVEIDDMTLRITDRHGTVRTLEAVALKWSWNGNPALLAFLSDITDQLRAEEALKTSEQFNRGLIENLPLGVMYLDEDGALTYENRAARRIVGAPEEGELPSRGLHLNAMLEGIPAEERPSVAPLFEGKTLKNIVFKYRSIYGKETIVESTGVPQIGSDGKPVGFVFTLADVTEREAYQRTIRESEEKYRLVVENASEAIIVTQNGRFRYANPRTCEISGYSQDELLEKTVFDLIHPDHKTFIENKYRNSIQSEQIETLHPFKAVRKDGTVLWVEITSVSLDWEGQPSTLNFLTDITDRQQATEALKESIERYESLYHGVLVGLVRTRMTDGTILQCNQHMARILGYDDREEFMREYRMIDNYVDPEVRRNLLTELNTAGHVHDYVACLRKRDGSPVWLSFTESSQTIEGCIDAVVMDITEEKHAKETQQQMLTALEQAGELMIITDADGTITYVNPAFVETTGYGHEEILGQNIRMLESGQHPDAYYQEAWDTIQRGNVWKGTFINRRKDGSLYEQSTVIAPICAQDGQVRNYVGVMRDVTRERLIETQLQQNQKMEAIGRLAGGIAHDFNNLLTSIKINVEILQMDLEQDEQLSQHVDEIAEGTERASDLTRQLLSFSRRAPTEQTITDPCVILPGMERLLKRIIGENIELVSLADPDTSSILVDPSQIQQILLNLAVNARDAMPGGGTLTIMANNMNLSAAEALEYADLKRGRYVEFIVMDTGTGMDEDTLHHLFEPFFSTKGTSGTGLGLAIVYSNVRQNKGYIECESSRGTGTRFRILFPVHDESGTEPEKETQQEPEQLAETVYGTECILVVEDEESILCVAVDLLTRYGYQVIPAQSGELALEIYQTTQDTSIDLLLTDVILPSMTGRDLAEKLLEINPDLPVIYTSGYTGDVIAQHGVISQEVSFIQKPYSTQALLGMVRRALDETRNESAQNHDGSTQ